MGEWGESPSRRHRRPTCRARANRWEAAGIAYLQAMRRIGRLGALLVVLLLFGAAANVAVAWALARWVEPLSGEARAASVRTRFLIAGGDSHGTNHAQVQTWNRPGAAFCEMSIRTVQIAPGPGPPRGTWVGPPDYKAPSWAGQWFERGVKRVAGSEQAWVAAAEARGLPFRALWCEHGIDVGPGRMTRTTEGGFAISQGFRGGGYPITLPFRPIWVGSVANTVFYAALLVGAWVVVRRWRIAVRRSRGHCPKCGYDLRRDFGGGCPECGWGRAGVARP